VKVNVGRGISGKMPIAAWDGTAVGERRQYSVGLTHQRYNETTSARCRCHDVEAMLQAESRQVLECVEYK
jgi:hypothetical protein